MPNITIHITTQQLLELQANTNIVISLSDDFFNGENTSPTKSGSIFEIFNEFISKNEKSGNMRTMEIYRTAFNKFRRYRKGQDLHPSELTTDAIESYQGFLRSNNLTMNTVSFYMRALRAVYKKAVERNITPDKKPFIHAFTGQAKTIKRALKLSTIRRIKNLKINKKEQIFARDMFMFSFYTRGMAFVDMAYLKKKDVHDGILEYKRRKTGQILSMKWEKEMQDIVNRYTNPDTEYLLPIILKQDGTERSQYRNCSGKVNKSLKIIAHRLCMKQKLTMYCARHSWATMAKDLKISLDVISRAMGHNNLRTTEIYLKSIESNAIDKANSKIIGKI